MFPDKDTQNKLKRINPRVIVTNMDNIIDVDSDDCSYHLRVNVSNPYALTFTMDTTQQFPSGFQGK